MTTTITLFAIASLALIAAIGCIWDSRQKRKKTTAPKQPQWTELDRIEAAKWGAKAEIRARRQQTEDQLRRLSRWYM